MKTALVTGASRGLGRVIAKKLSASGYSVGINYAHSAQGAESVADEIRKAGGTAEVFGFDVTDEDQVQAGMAQVRAKLGQLDCLVNNAIGHHDLIPVEEQTWEDHWNQIKFCSKAPVLLMREIVGPWKERGSGRIINMGSEVSDIGNEAFAHYVGAKTAMVGLTRSWARDLGPHGITVNLVSPGFITVERHEDMAKDQMVADYLPHLPFNRMGMPEDIAGTVAFLASDEASFINGQTIAVNGGRTLA